MDSVICGHFILCICNLSINYINYTNAYRINRHIGVHESRAPALRSADWCCATLILKKLLIILAQWFLKGKLMFIKKQPLLVIAENKRSEHSNYYAFRNMPDNKLLCHQHCRLIPLSTKLDFAFFLFTYADQQSHTRSCHLYMYYMQSQSIAVQWFQSKRL